MNMKALIGKLENQIGDGRLRKITIGMHIGDLIRVGDASMPESCHTSNPHFPILERKGIENPFLRWFCRTPFQKIPDAHIFKYQFVYMLDQLCSNEKLQLLRKTPF